jgi:hypothetical protein
MRVNGRDIYKSIEKRTFKTAIIQLLEKEYKILGSHKVIEMIADDIEQLHREFYPESTSNKLGYLRWITTSEENNKPGLGQKVEEYKSTTVDLPYLTEEDIRLKEEGITNREHDLIRIERLTKAAKEQGGLLSIVELAAILNCSTGTITNRIREYKKREKKTFPLKGYVLDIGRGTTHKSLIIEFYEEGVAPPDISRRTYHSLEAVDRYIKDYERVKFLRRKGLKKKEISRSINRGEDLVREYLQILKRYHPEIGEPNT